MLQPHRVFIITLKIICVASSSIVITVVKLSPSNNEIIVM